MPSLVCKISFTKFPINNLSFSKLKDPLNRLNYREISSISCQCGLSYIRQTKSRYFRFYEYKLNVGHKEKNNKSTFDKHFWENKLLLFLVLQKISLLFSVVNDCYIRKDIWTELLYGVEENHCSFSSRDTHFQVAKIGLPNLNIHEFFYRKRLTHSEKYVKRYLYIQIEENR